jgi:hypothetical protein
MLRQFVRKLLPPDPHTPSLVRQLFSAPYRRLRRMERAVQEATGRKIVSGPFKGLRYVERSIGSMYGAKLLGTYEKELESVIGQIIARGYPLVIDIGAAEGYYAVGLAMRMPPTTRIVAFEAQTEQHSVLRALAQKNGVQDRITLHGYGTPQLLRDELAKAAGGKALIICDVEGFEEELLDPSAVPALQHADVLVELHEFMRPGISPKIRQRFAKTHRITEIHARQRTMDDWPAGVALDPSLRLMAMHEGRPEGMRWFWMEALT